MNKPTLAIICALLITGGSPIVDAESRAESEASAEASGVHVLNGYACGVRYIGTPKGSNTMGDHGYVALELNSGPNCTGDPVGLAYFCSAGATASECVYPDRTEAMILALWSNLRAAAVQGQGLEVSVYGVNRGWYVTFLGS